VVILALVHKSTKG